jgi:hypothetical protein
MNTVIRQATMRYQCQTSAAALRPARLSPSEQQLGQPELRCPAILLLRRLSRVEPPLDPPASTFPRPRLDQLRCAIDPSFRQVLPGRARKAPVVAQLKRDYYCGNSTPYLATDACLYSCFRRQQCQHLNARGPARTCSWSLRESQASILRPPGGEFSHGRIACGDRSIDWEQIVRFPICALFGGPRLKARSC